MIRRVAVIALLLAGCAAPERARSPSLEPPGVRGKELQQASEEIRRRDAELQQLGLKAASPDCAQIGQLRDNICTLAARICEIAAQQPAHSDAAVNAGLLCSDGQTRCKRAIERAQAAGCPKR
jgi:hypothetical protein